MNKIYKQIRSQLPKNLKHISSWISRNNRYFIMTYDENNNKKYLYEILFYNNKPYVKYL